MKEKIKFAGLVTAVHMGSYILCGMVFTALFQYGGSLAANGMREMDSPLVQMAPLFQIVRGLLYGIVLWWIREPVLKGGWFKLWLLLIILGIFNTPGTAPGSIEELIYKPFPAVSWNLGIGGMLEVLTQTLLFSVAVSYLLRRQRKEKRAPST